MATGNINEQERTRLVKGFCVEEGRFGEQPICKWKKWENPTIYIAR
jgi:hypothetical protein